MKTAHPELLPLFFEYGIDIQKRLLYLGSLPNMMEADPGVDFRMAERAIKGLMFLDSLQYGTGKKKRTVPITIALNTPGGDVDHGLAIYDAIKSCLNPVHIIVYGRAHSMGSIILQAADRRIMAPNASIMIHYGECYIEGHPKLVAKFNSQLKRNKLFMEQLFHKKMKEKNPKISLKKVQKMLDFDTFFTPAEAIKYGLADGILNSK
jgi:ATP-dependent Clp protease protease subunit